MALLMALPSILPNDSAFANGLHTRMSSASMKNTDS
jgi:hypothetical protein